MEAPAGPTPYTFNATTTTLLLVVTMAAIDAHVQQQRLGIGRTLKRHPFSGLVDSAGELLHTP